MEGKTSSLMRWILWSSCHRLIKVSVDSQGPRLTTGLRSMHDQSPASKHLRPSNGLQQDRIIKMKADLCRTPYYNCKTRIVDLRDLPPLPRGQSVTDEDYRKIYKDYLRTKRHLEPSSTAAADHELEEDAGQTGKLSAQSQQLRAAIQSLTAGIAPPVAFPTETVYGLGADATNAASIAGIFAAKGRPNDNPLIVHISSIAHLERCLGGTAEDPAIPAVYQELIAEFWPGPLTILVPVPEEGKGLRFAPNVHPGQKTIGFRLPESPYARFLIAIADRPIAAPSANSSGKPSPTTAQHVKEDLDGKINFILDGGNCDVGVESTVVDGLHDPPLILRPGGLAKHDLREWGKKKDNIWQYVQNGWEYKTGSKRKRNDRTTTDGIGNKLRKTSPESEDVSNVYDSPTVQTPRDENLGLRLSEDDTTAPRAPGMKYKHYAPAARMLLFEGRSTQETSSLVEIVRHRLEQLLQIQLPGSRKLGSSPDAKGVMHTICIGVLNTTSWPDLTELAPKCIQPLPAASDAEVSSMDSLENMRYFHYSTILPPSGGTTALPVEMYQILLGHSPQSIARNLFAALRQCDSWKCDYILVEAPEFSSTIDPSLQASENEKFETVLERMRKAASEIITS